MRRKSQEVKVMDSMNVNITVGGASSVQNDTSEGRNTYQVAKRVQRKDRRRNNKDRRRSVREGIFVSLSVGDDRRILRDRRKARF